MSLDLVKVATTEAPAAVGPYSQAVIAGEFVFVSGQIPLDPRTGELVEGGFEDQAAQSLANVDAVLVAAGSHRSKVVKATVFLTSMSNFGQLNEVYGRYFGDHRPARAAFEVSALPKGAAVEIEVVAVR